eukprot:12417837-Alexandrium_andersonii.AAC.1
MALATACGILGSRWAGRNKFCGSTRGAFRCLRFRDMAPPSGSHEGQGAARARAVAGWPAMDMGTLGWG